jgi:hypothetical protein
MSLGTNYLRCILHLRTGPLAGSRLFPTSPPSWRAFLGNAIAKCALDLPERAHVRPLILEPELARRDTHPGGPF